MTDLSSLLEDARLSDDPASDDTVVERERERAARRIVRAAGPVPLPGAPLDTPCPHCGGSGVLHQISRAERMRLNDRILSNRKPGDPLPPRNGPAPQAAMVQMRVDTEGELRSRADHVLDVIETDGRLAPRRTQEDGLIAWGSDDNAGTPIV